MTRILKYVSRYKSFLILGTISMLVVIGVDLFMPYLQQIFIDDGIINGNKDIIKIALIGILIITIIKAILGYGKEFLYDLLSVKVHEDIKNIANIDYETSGDFETLSSTLYQFQKLYEFIVQKCNLNKIITTRDTLMDTIISRASPGLSKKLCNYVKYVNGENTTMNVSKKTLSRYKKMILDLGYHYLYSDVEIQPLHLEELFFKHLYYSSAA